MVYRKLFKSFLEDSFLNDKDAALLLGCSLSALELWKANENTAPKDAIHALELYTNKVSFFKRMAQEALNNPNDSALDEDMVQHALETLQKEMHRNHIYKSSITNMMASLTDIDRNSDYEPV